MGLELKAMRLRTWLAIPLCCLALPLLGLGQNSPSAPGDNQSGSAQSSESGNSTPQPVTGSSNSGGGQQDDSSQSGPDKKPSGIKKVLRRAAPNCAHVGAGGDHCWSESGREKEAEEKRAEETQQQPAVPPSQPAPRSDEQCDDCSSSRSGRVDLNPPPGDAATHEGADLPSDVQELHPWNPHRADKDVEVGDFYFKQKNYRAAIARYRDALSWMSNHAAATYKLGLALEKNGEKSEAREHYQQYLKLLPDGPYAEAARKALERLPAATTQSRATPPPAQKSR